MKTLKFKKSNLDIYKGIRDKLIQLTLNDYVKIQVEVIGEGSEIFWVRVLKVTGNKVTGIVVNDLILKESFDFNRGSEIHFEKKNVLEIMKDADVAVVLSDFKSNIY